MWHVTKQMSGFFTTICSNQDPTLATRHLFNTIQCQQNHSGFKWCALVSRLFLPAKRYEDNFSDIRWNFGTIVMALKIIFVVGYRPIYSMLCNCSPRSWKKTSSYVYNDVCVICIWDLISAMLEVLLINELLPCHCWNEHGFVWIMLCKVVSSQHLVANVVEIARKYFSHYDQSWGIGLQGQIWQISIVSNYNMTQLVFVHTWHSMSIFCTAHYIPRNRAWPSYALTTATSSL